MVQIFAKISAEGKATPARDTRVRSSPSKKARPVGPHDGKRNPFHVHE